jgi:hypothetical protein
LSIETHQKNSRVIVRTGTIMLCKQLAKHLEFGKCWLLAPLPAPSTYGISILKICIWTLEALFQAKAVSSASRQGTREEEQSSINEGR